MGTAGIVCFLKCEGSSSLADAAARGRPGSFGLMPEAVQRTAQAHNAISGMLLLATLLTKVTDGRCSGRAWRSGCSVVSGSPKELRSQ